MSPFGLRRKNLVFPNIGGYGERLSSEGFENKTLVSGWKSKLPCPDADGNREVYLMTK